MTPTNEAVSEKRCRKCRVNVRRSELSALCDECYATVEIDHDAPIASIADLRERYECLKTEASSLRSECERLKAELSKHQESEFHPDWSMLQAGRESLREHMELLRDASKENALLRKALEDMLSGWKYIRETHGDLYGVGWDRAQSAAESALNPPPKEGGKE